MSGGTILDFGRGLTAANPISDPVDLALKLQQFEGAEGYKIEGNTVIALRWDTNGSEIVLGRFEAR
jgi:hypothetical protein